MATRMAKVKEVSTPRMRAMALKAVARPTERIEPLDL